MSEVGVGFVIKTELVDKLSGLPKGINDRLLLYQEINMESSLPMAHPDVVKDMFYNDLGDGTSAIPRTDKQN